jgi:amino acid transporter
MKPNMGTIDRLVRIMVAVSIGMAYMMDMISGTVAILLGIVAIAFVITSFIGWCPAYIPFGLSTRLRDKKQE